MGMTEFSGVPAYTPKFDTVAEASGRAAGGPSCTLYPKGATMSAVGFILQLPMPLL